jgi:hypothetical protein
MFRLNENNELYCMAHDALEFKYIKLNSNFIELNSNLIEFRLKWIESNSNSNMSNEIQTFLLKWIQIQLNLNKMQIGAQGIENMFIIAIIYNYGVEKKNLSF